MSISPATTLDLLAPIDAPRVPRRYRGGWQRRRNARIWDEIHHEDLNPDSTPVFDYGTVPGEVVSDEIIESRNETTQLIALVQQFVDSGFSWSEDTDAKLSFDTAAASTAFLCRLHDTYRSPKIAPDGEGGLMMVWEGRGDPIVGVVDGWKLNFVFGAGTPHAHYFDNVSFDGESIPECILRRIPLR